MRSDPLTRTLDAQASLNLKIRLITEPGSIVYVVKAGVCRPTVPEYAATVSKLVLSKLNFVKLYILMGKRTHL